jgi:hypothetical protein
MLGVVLDGRAMIYTAESSLVALSLRDHCPGTAVFLLHLYPVFFTWLAPSVGGHPSSLLILVFGEPIGHVFVLTLPFPIGGFWTPRLVYTHTPLLSLAFPLHR